MAMRRDSIGAEIKTLSSVRREMMTKTLLDKQSYRQETQSGCQTRHTEYRYYCSLGLGLGLVQVQESFS